MWLHNALTAMGRWYGNLCVAIERDIRGVSKELIEVLYYHPAN